MAKPRRDDRPRLLGKPPDEVQVTVTARPHGLRMRDRLSGLSERARSRVLVGIVVVAVGIVTLAAGSRSGHGGTAGSERSQARLIEYGRIRAWARCLNAVNSSGLSSSPREDFDHTVWCERYSKEAASNSYRFIGGPLPVFALPRR